MLGMAGWRWSYQHFDAVGFGPLCCALRQRSLAYQAHGASLPFCKAMNHGPYGCVPQFGKQPGVQSLILRMGMAKADPPLAYYFYRIHNLPICYANKNEPVRLALVRNK
jgi:hypothetical protein